MADFTALLNDVAPRSFLSSAGRECLPAQFAATVGSWGAAATPAANRALYIPVQVARTMTITNLGVFNGAGVAGTIDVGLYDFAWRRLTSIGSGVNQAGASGIQVFDVTNVTITPGTYWLGWVASTVTTATYQRQSVNVLVLQASGVQQEALGSAVLPATATPANPASSYLPWVAAYTRTSI